MRLGYRYYETSKEFVVGGSTYSKNAIISFIDSSGKYVFRMENVLRIIYPILNPGSVGSNKNLIIAVFLDKLKLTLTLRRDEIKIASASSYCHPHIIV